MGYVKKQYNLTLDEDIVKNVQILSVILGLPQYAVCEHIIQIGGRQLYQEIDNPERKRELYEHLVNNHLR